MALVSIFYSSDVPSDELSLLEKSLFTAMTLNPLQTLLGLSRQPLEDVHYPVLKVFISLAKYKWAQEHKTTCLAVLE